MSPWAFDVPLVLVSALGLLLNVYVLLIVGLTKQLQRQRQTEQPANTMLLIHLGAVEATTSLVLILVFATGEWPMTGTPCVLHGFLLALLHPVALWTVTGLNCDRYYAISAPLHYATLVSTRRVTVGLTSVWIVALLLSLPPFSGLVPPYRYSPDLGCCFPDFGNGGWGSAAAWYGLVYAFVGLALPVILVTLCNVRVLGIARYHRHRIAGAIYQVTLSAQVTVTHRHDPFPLRPRLVAAASSTWGPPGRFHGAALTVMQLVGSAYLLYLPYCGLIVWETRIAKQSTHPRFASLAVLLLACSSPINGLLYGLRSRGLRRSIRNYKRKKATETELQQEIQARTPSAAGSRRASGSATTSLFSFAPLQRRLGEAFLGVAAARLQGSNVEIGTGSLRRSTTIEGTGSSLIAEKNPRILVTRAYSEEDRDASAKSPLLGKPVGSVTPPFVERRRRSGSTLATKRRYARIGTPEKGAARTDHRTDAVVDKAFLAVRSLDKEARSVYGEEEKREEEEEEQSEEEEEEEEEDNDDKVEVNAWPETPKGREEVLEMSESRSGTRSREVVARSKSLMTVSRDVNI